MALRNEMISQGNWLFKYRSYLPIVIIFPGLFLIIQNVLNNTYQESHLNNLYEYLYLGICILGLLIRIIAIGYSADNTSGRNTSQGQIADTINSDGLYNIVRHPLYVGNFFMWVGIACFTHNIWFVIAFIFMYWVYYERIMYAEENYLIDKFKDVYVEYSNKIPAFVPNSFNWKKPKIGFSWKKIIRQEKSGILWLFVIIFAFKVIEGYISHDSFFIYNRFWLYGLGVAIGWYLLIKIIQKTTNLLEIDR